MWAVYVILDIISPWIINDTTNQTYKIVLKIVLKF